MGEVKADAVLDLRGVVCPINFVKTKLKLESMDRDRCLRLCSTAANPSRMSRRASRKRGIR